MAGQVRAAVDAAVGAVRRRQVRLERLDGRARDRRRALACHPATVSHPLTHECLLATNTHPSATSATVTLPGPARTRIVTDARHQFVTSEIQPVLRRFRANTEDKDVVLVPKGRSP